jgi:hypothetical protein
LEDGLIDKAAIRGHGEMDFLFCDLIFSLEMEDRLLYFVKDEQGFTPIKIEKTVLGKKWEEKIEGSLNRRGLEVLISPFLKTIGTFEVAPFSQKNCKSGQFHY